MYAASVASPSLEASVINGGDGNDSLTVLAKNTEIGAAKLIGDGGDVLDGDAGNDGVEVNGAPTLGDVFTLEPNAGRIKFRRTNLVAFTLDASIERFQVNGLGGNDSMSANAGVGALTLLSVDGGAGVDTVLGSDGPDLILGGEDNDSLGGGGGDRIVGDRGTNTMNGGAGDYTLVWNDGDGTDVANGRHRRRRGQRRSGGGRRVHRSSPTARGSSSTARTSCPSRSTSARARRRTPTASAVTTPSPSARS